MRDNPFIPIAKIISVIGHPLLTACCFTLIISFRLFKFEEAIFISTLIIGGVGLPLTFWNLYKTKKGHYSNFDVSDRKQRQGFYPMLIILLALANVILFLTHQPAAFSFGLLFSIAMLIFLFVLNFKIKSSLHTAIAFFISFALMPLTVIGGVLFFFFAAMIGVSRIILKRHTISEIVMGAVIGMVFGVSHYFFQMHYLGKLQG